jgi:hypothetical protein
MMTVKGCGRKPSWPGVSFDLRSRWELRQEKLGFQGRDGDVASLQNVDFFLVFFKYRTQSSGKDLVNIIQVHSDLHRNATFSSRFISWTFFPCRRFRKIVNEM